MNDQEKLNLRALWVDDIRQQGRNGNKFLMYYQEFSTPVAVDKNNILHYFNLFNVRDKISSELLEFVVGVMPKLANGEALNSFEVAMFNTIMEQYFSTFPKPDDPGRLDYIMRARAVQKDLWVQEKEEELVDDRKIRY